MSNKVKIMNLMSYFQEIHYRKIDGKMDLSVWISFCDIEFLTKIMGCSYFDNDAPVVVLLEDCIYIRDFIPFLEYLSFSDEEITEICNKYGEV